MTAVVPASPTRRRNQKPYEAGGAGTIEVVKIDDLRIDHLYQRDLNPTVVEKIAAEYDIVTCGTIVVSERATGERYVVDGQHRLAGAKLAGETEILAQIVHNLTPEEEAKLRVQGNYARPDRSQEVFRARLFAGDPIAVGMQAVCNEYDTRINFMPDMNHGINAVAAVEQIYRTDKGPRLRNTLGTIRQAWGTAEGAHVSSAILKGITFFLDRHETEIDRSRFIERIKTEGVGAIGRMARNHKAALGGTLWLNTYRALVEVYNYNLRENSKLEWRTGRSSKVFSGGDGGSGS